MAIEEIKLIREKLQLCYQTEGVNHLQNCRDLRLAYMERIQAKEFPFKPVSTLVLCARRTVL